MSVTTIVILTGAAGMTGLILGYFLRWILTLGKKGSLELEIKEKKLAAEEEAQTITQAAEKKAETIVKEAQEERKENEEKLEKREERIVQKEEFLDKRQLEIDKEMKQLKEKAREVKDTRKQAEKIKSQHKEELERVAGLTKKQAKEELLEQVKDRYEEDLLMRMRKLERSNNEQLKARAKDIVISAMQRFGNSVSADIMSTTVELPAEDVKGKIIGKDGRNIRAFEKETGVELVIDDTPETVLISSFDPVRRQVARVALENLILDGRIQPARIEEMVADAREEINTIIKEKGEEAVYEAGAYDLDERIVSILGRLYFRTSYGQNVLQHSIEMAHIAGMLAEEIDADVQVAKTGALVHDIGKAVDHEISGTHVDIGMRILQKFGAPQDVIDAMKSHHEDYPYESTEAVIVQTADAISGSRPGARRENMEEYLERLADLEAIADNTAGVDRSYAIQAGREVRVFVDPEAISDLEAKKTARDIAERIEDEISYPGEVKVHIIREKRDVHYAR